MLVYPDRCPDPDPVPDRSDLVASVAADSYWAIDATANAICLRVAEVELTLSQGLAQQVESGRCVQHNAVLFLFSFIATLWTLTIGVDSMQRIRLISVHFGCIAVVNHGFNAKDSDA